MPGIMTGYWWSDPDHDRFLQALCAIAEGFCPMAHGLLEPDAHGETFTTYGQAAVTAFSSGGWCGECRIWWRRTEQSDGPYVTANYPAPSLAVAPYDVSTSVKVPW